MDQGVQSGLLTLLRCLAHSILNHQGHPRNGKENGCEWISDWLKGAQNHLYMCATCTRQGLGELTMAKWKSFMRHVANKHEDHPSLFKQCAHEKEIESRRWIKINCEMWYFFHCLCTGLLALYWQHSFHCAKCCYRLHFAYFYCCHLLHLQRICSRHSPEEFQWKFVAPEDFQSLVVLAVVSFAWEISRDSPIVRHCFTDEK